MDNYKNIEHIIIHFFQGNITEEEMKMLMDWFNGSDRNKQLFFQLKNMHESLKGKSALTPDDIRKSKERLFEKINKTEKVNNQQQTSLLRRKQLGIGLRYTAVAIIACILTFGVQRAFNKNGNTFIEFDLESGPRMSHMTLPDGTKVVLNASSKLKFPEKFNKTREVYLDGEAFFDVVSNTKNPFIVYTSKQKIQVLGTKFNVMDYSVDDYSITTLVSGKIKMQPVSEDGDWGDDIYLKANQQIFFNNKTNQLALSDIKIDNKRTWVNKVYHFKAEPLFQITKRLEKIYGIKINIANEELKDVEYTGTFGLDQEIDAVLKIINFDHQFSYSQTNNEITIQRLSDSN